MQNKEPLGEREHMLGFADRLIKKAEVFEKHQRLGHLRHVDGHKIASDLRETAQKIRQDHATE